MGNSVGWIVLLFLLNELPGSKADNYIRKAGYCMWYGQCGTNPTTATHKAINCLYNGPAKKVDEPSCEILAHLCPEFAHPDSKVCCSYDQIVSLQSGIQSAEEMMARCPSCWKNFRELYCRLTCSPNGSLFMDPTQLTEDKTAIVAIDYYVEKAFKDGLYNSCKDVIFPSSHKKIMNFMCGTRVENCTPQKFLDFMSDPEANGVSPFLIQYPLSYESPITPMNTTVRLCNESFFDPSVNTTRLPCSCEDCPASCDSPFPINPEHLTVKIFFSLKPSSKLNKRTCYKNFFSKDCILTGTILRFEILNKVLVIQAHLMNMSVGSESITLRDFCVKPMAPQNNNCIVASVLQYWQNDIKKLNKCISALSEGQPCSNPDDFAKRASWGDHLVKCACNPASMDDGTVLHLPCKSLYGGSVLPEQVLGGYEGKHYTDASLLYVTFVIRKNLTPVEVKKMNTWQESFVDYLKSYHDDDLQLAYVPVDFPNSKKVDTEA